MRYLYCCVGTVLLTNTASKVGVRLRLEDQEFPVKECYKGLILTHFPSTERPDPYPLQPMQSFRAQILVLRPPRKGLMRRYTGLMACHGAAFPVTIVDLTQRCNKIDGSWLEDNPRSLALGERGRAILEPYTPTDRQREKMKRLLGGRSPSPPKRYCVDTAERFQMFGRFVVYNSKAPVFAGLIEEVNPKQS